MIIPNGYGQVTHFFSSPGYPVGAAITYGIARADSGLSSADIAALAHDNLGDNWTAFWSSQTSLVQTLCKFGPNASGESALATGTRTGTGSVDSAPPNTALLIRKNTAVGGRSGRGRLFMVGLADSSVVAGGFIGSGAQTAAQTAADTWFARMTAEDWPMALLHAATSDPTVVTGLTVQGTAATIRRRLRR